MDYDRTVRRALRLSVLAASVVSLGACAAVMVSRLLYPYEAEWIEGAMVDAVARVAAGRTLYEAPSLEFVALIYAPLYFYVSAATAALTGIGFFPLRLVSVMSTVIGMALIYRLASRDAGGREAGILAIGLFASTYGATGTWFDLARVDGLALALALGGVTLARYANRPVTLALGGGLLALAVHTKQSMVFLAVSSALYVIWRRPRRDAASFLSALAGVGLVLSAVFVVAFGEWYAYYVYELPMYHAPFPPARLGFWVDDILGKIPVIAILAVVCLARGSVGPSADLDRRPFLLCLLAGAIGCSWFTRMNAGAWINVLIPAYAALCLLAALGLGSIWAAGASGRARRALQAATGVALIAQFAALGYRPLNQMPTGLDKEAADRFVKTLAGIDGDVWVLSHGYVGSLANKPPHPHWQAVADVLRTPDSPTREAFASGLVAAFRDKRFAAVISDGWEPLLDQTGLGSYYREVPWDFEALGLPRPVTGALNRPAKLFVPR